MSGATVIQMARVMPSAMPIHRPSADFGCDESLRPPLVPAKAGTQGRLDLWPWIPAFAGMSGVWVDITENRSSAATAA
jgi:hypothetical protein